MIVRQLPGKFENEVVEQASVDQRQPAKLEVIPIVRASSLSGTKAPRRRFVIDGIIPDRTVTAYSGDGGVGKSLVALQMSVAVVLGRPWLGIFTESGPVLSLTAEDELDEIHRRLEDICRSEEVGLAQLDDLHLLPLAGRDALLAIPDRDRGMMKPTPLFQRLRSDLASIRPRMLVIDTLADVFGGNEIDRAQARSFIGMLRGLALEFGMAVVILSHPSLAGMASGTGSSGSTGWTNSVRSRVYQERPKPSEDDLPDAEARILSVKKANYGPIGLTIPLRWQNGVFVRDDEGANTEREAALEAKASAADGAFLRVLRLVNEQGGVVSPSPSSNYAPKIFEGHPEAAGFKKRAFVPAMQRLLQSNMIHIKTDGPASRRRKQLMAGPAPIEHGTTKIEPLPTACQR
ncbi:RecA-family ATPase [Nitrobacteraceae bacterium AZCC 2146]